MTPAYIILAPVLLSRAVRRMRPVLPRSNSGLDGSFADGVTFTRMLAKAA